MNLPNNPIKSGTWRQAAGRIDCWLSHFQKLCFCGGTTQTFKGYQICFKTLWTDKRWCVLAPNVDISNVFLYNEFLLRNCSRPIQYVLAELTVPGGKAEGAGLMDLSAERHLCSSAWEWWSCCRPNNTLKTLYVISLKTSSPASAVI